MRNTPILIPILLVICLGTMAYLLFAAFKSNGAADLPRVAAGVSAPEAYESDAGLLAGDKDDRSLDRYYEDIPENEKIYPESEAPMFKADDDVSNDWEGNGVTRELMADKRGHYIILAGSFRQKINAEAQVKKLLKAGFAESEVNLSTGGAYAMAFVGRRSDENEANELLKELKSKGFDARIVRR